MEKTSKKILYRSCNYCNGSGFIKRLHDDNCINCMRNNLQICYLCENSQSYIKSIYQLCNYCNGCGEIKITN